MEKVRNATSGYLMVLVVFLTLLVGLAGIVLFKSPIFILIILVAVLLSIGFTVVNPNKAVVMTLFGAYSGTIKTNGFFWVNPFFVKRKISLMIGLVLVWTVYDTYKASFAVDEFQHFVVVQSEAALRKLAGIYPYDDFDDHDAEITLRSGGEEVNHELEREIIERLDIAGIEVIEARINYIAYAQEIAQAMLKRQQATAIVAARFKIVEGAVSMVDMALEQLAEKKIVELDADKRATMVSNLMVVLCGDKEATPIVNTGTLYQ